jgi:hypothetical protein
MVNPIGTALGGLNSALKKVGEAAEGIVTTQDGANLSEDIVKMHVGEAEYKANLVTIKVANEMSDELLHLFDETI